MHFPILGSKQIQFQNIELYNLKYGYNWNFLKGAHTIRY